MVALPCPSVVSVAGLRNPPPALTAKVTATPDIGDPDWSLTVTPIAVGTAVPTMLVCPLPTGVTVVGIGLVLGPLPSEQPASATAAATLPPTPSTRLHRMDASRPS